MSKERLVDLHVEAVAAWDTYLDMCEEQDVEPEKTFDEFVADYLLANGVIVPLCKVGQTVWSAFWCVRSHKVIRIEITESELIVATNDYRFNFSDFGRVVFLTREEAEKELEKRDV